MLGDGCEWVSSALSLYQDFQREVIMIVIFKALLTASEDTFCQHSCSKLYKRQQKESDRL